MKKAILCQLVTLLLFSCKDKNPEPQKPCGPVTKNYVVNTVYHYQYCANPPIDTSYPSTLTTVEENETMTVRYYLRSGKQTESKLTQRYAGNDTLRYWTPYSIPSVGILITQSSSKVTFRYVWDESSVGQNVKETYVISN